MNGKCRKTIKKNARVELAQLRRNFLERFLADMRMPVGMKLHPPSVCWLDPNGHINHLRVHAYMQPQVGMSDRPLIPRLYVNHYVLDHPERIARRMGWELRPFGEFDERLRWSFELSMLPSQLSDFAPWVVSLAEAHAANESSMVMSPPHKCHFWSDKILDCNYAWSTAAWREIKAYEKRHKQCAA